MKKQKDITQIDPNPPERQELPGSRNSGQSPAGPKPADKKDKTPGVPANEDYPSESAQVKHHITNQDDPGFKPDHPGKSYTVPDDDDDDDIRDRDDVGFDDDNEEF